MSTPQSFRSALNGFNREDVVHYLEYLNTKHTNQVNQLTAENDALRQQVEALPELENQQSVISSLEDRCDELTRQLEAARARCAELEQQLGIFFSLLAGCRVDDCCFFDVLKSEFSSIGKDFLTVSDEDDVCKFISESLVRCCYCALFERFREHDALFV